MAIIADEVLKIRSISGFVYQYNMIHVLNIYNRAPCITPPQFIPIDNELMTGRTGFYVGMAAKLKNDDIDELRNYIDDIEIN